MCQRYDGADLYNPEYPEEAAFLQSLLQEEDTLGEAVWTGIHNDNSTPIYMVSSI